MGWMDNGGGNGKENGQREKCGIWTGHECFRGRNASRILRKAEKEGDRTSSSKSKPQHVSLLDRRTDGRIDGRSWPTRL